MPEEINRLLTDAISDYLFVTEPGGMINLAKEGVPESKVFFVGNCMIDSLVNYLTKADKSLILSDYDLQPGKYVLVTLHRPSNVDNEMQLKKLFEMLNKIALERKVIFPIHPRTIKNIDSFGMTNEISKNIVLTEPIGYIDFLALIKNAELILTDSGGIQEESTFLGVQCITLRTTTERPVTVDVGTNQLLGDNLSAAEKAALEVLHGKKKNGTIPELWDGKAAERIVKKLVDLYPIN
jgi:UDP-N-acetylglucosamine 2-epimerase (non-hydrolysing)